ncbi:hypothetical protein ACVWXS_004341 [Lysinibacillus sp. TE18511]
MFQIPCTHAPSTVLKDPFIFTIDYSLNKVVLGVFFAKVLFA